MVLKADMMLLDEISGTRNLKRQHFDRKMEAALVHAIINTRTYSRASIVLGLVVVLVLERLAERPRTRTRARTRTIQKIRHRTYGDVYLIRD